MDCMNQSVVQFVARKEKCVKKSRQNLAIVIKNILYEIFDFSKEESIMAKNNNEAYTADYFAQYDSSITNGEARIPICFCIDVSSSMNFITNPESDFIVLNNGVTFSEDGCNKVRRVKLKDVVKKKCNLNDLKRVLLQMINRMQQNAIIADSAVVSIVTFSLFADCIVEFSDVNRINPSVISNIKAEEDRTNAAKGIYMALERLEQLKKLNKNAGNDSYRPVMVFMSDGNPTDINEARNAGNQIREMADQEKLNVIPIAIGNDIDETWLRRLSHDSHVYHMRYEKEFDEVFSKITSRIEKVGRVISLDEELIQFEDENIEDSEGTQSTKYGAETEEEDLMAFLDEFKKL